jgi:ubiquinone biosynthesis protein Coq4
MQKLIDVGKFIKAFFRLALNPNDTGRVFAVSEKLLKLTNMTTPEKKEVVFKKLIADKPSIQKMIQQRYLAPAYKVEDLAGCPVGSLGYAYYRHMHDNGFEPDFFPPTNPNEDIGYFLLRMRQSHDIWHVVTGFSPSWDDELGLQAFGAAQGRIPFQTMIVAGGILHGIIFPHRFVKMLKAIKKGTKAGKTARPLHAAKWESDWNRPLAEVRREYNLTPVSTVYDFAPEPARELAQV